MPEEIPIADLEKRVAAQLQTLLDQREPVLVRLPGILGLTNDAGSAAVSTMPGWVYVRVGNDETITRAFNNRTANRNGLPVVVGYDPAQPGLFQVLSERQVYSGTWAGGGTIGSHHAQHEFGNSLGGDDLVWIRMRQLVDFLVYPTNPESLTVNIGDGVYFMGSTPYYYEGGTVDLTSSVPSTYSRWVLIALNASGVYTVEGTAKYGLTYADIPDATDPTDFKLAAVWLDSTTTEITDWPDPVMIVDLRLAGSRSMSGAGGFVTFGNVYIVATSGGNYDAVQDAVDASGTSTHVLVLNGSYAENVAVSAYLIISALKDGHYCGSAGSYLTGEDDTGPILDLDAGLVQGLVLARELSGGSGTFYGIDASGSAADKHISDLKVRVDAGSTGRAVVACKIEAQNGATISRCNLINDDSGSGGSALEIAGANPVTVEYSVMEDEDGGPALRITGTGTFYLYQCRVLGDVIISGAATVRFRNCRIEGDVTVSAAATVDFRECYVAGDITDTGSATAILGPGLVLASGKTASGFSVMLPGGLLTESTNDIDHYLSAKANNKASHVRVTPIGTLGSINRASLGAFFTEYLGESNWENVELVAFYDGTDTFGVIRCMAGGTGTVHDLRLGAGSDKTKYIIIDSSGNVFIPATLDVDTINEYTADAGVTIDGVLIKDGLVDGVDVSAIGAVTKVRLYSSGSITEYSGDDSGLASAIAAASSGDMILVPIATYANDYTIPAGVSLVGVSIHDVVFSGQITLSNGSVLEQISITRSKNDSSTYYGVVGPSSGTGYIHVCRISVTQAGAGSGYGISVNGVYGDVEMYGGRVFGTTADVYEN